MILSLIIFCIFILSLLLTVIAYNRYISVSSTTTYPTTTTSVQCDPSSLLFAWVQGISSSASCPSFVNQLVVDEAVLYERYFLVDPETQCCWFSTLDTQRTSISNPYILAASKTAKVYPDSTLNENPYLIIAPNTVSTNVAFCNNDQDCILLALVGEENGVGVYKIVKYSDTSNVYDPNSLNFIQAALFYISNNGETLDQVLVNGQQSQISCPLPTSAPLAAQYIVNLFCEGGRMYPVAGIVV
jgi:hypothetical protein